jgi:hypothetical protein
MVSLGKMGIFFSACAVKSRHKGKKEMCRMSPATLAHLHLDKQE